MPGKMTDRYMKPENLSGIYRILNAVNGNCYIGSAVKFSQRWDVHRCQLLANKHHSAHLQTAFNKYGIAAFKFEILLACSKENLIPFEQWAINTYNPEYNICRIAGSSLGRKVSDETRAKIVIANTGRKASDETRAKIAASSKGRKVSDETKAKMSAKSKGNTYRRGSKASDETKAKISATKRNKSLLNIDIVSSIRLDWATKEFKQTELAVKYGISKYNIWNIIYNRSWKEETSND